MVGGNSVVHFPVWVPLTPSNLAAFQHASLLGTVIFHHLRLAGGEAGEGLG